MNNFSEGIKNLLNKIKESFIVVLGKNLVGIYIHGSLAMGCFNPEFSDIDFLVVVKEKLSVEDKKKIIGFSLKLSKEAPAKGLEYSIVKLNDLKNFKHPTPYELHFSVDWKERYTKNQVDLEKQNFDPDLAAHVVVTQKRGVCLIGEPIEKVFLDIDEKYYLDSLSQDIKYLSKRFSQNPVYAVLNLCRVIAYRKDKVVLSKKEGGEWAIKNLDKKYHSLIVQALDQYAGKNKTNWDINKVRGFIESTKILAEPS